MDNVIIKDDGILIKLRISPNSSKNQILPDGDIIKLGRFDDESWVVHFGWFSFGGNRPICGWYLSSCINEERVKPLSLTDIDDIYLIEH